GLGAEIRPLPLRLVLRRGPARRPSAPAQGLRAARCLLGQARLPSGPGTRGHLPLARPGRNRANGQAHDFLDQGIVVGIPIPESARSVLIILTYRWIKSIYPNIPII